MHSHHSGTVLSALFSATLAVFSTSANAVNQGDWLVRVGVGHVHPNDSSSAVTGIAGSGVSVGSATNLDLTISYFLTPNVNVELLGALPFKHDIKGTGVIAGLGKIGETKQLPPTLVLNYMFNPQSNIRPYVGAGINYTTFFSTKTTDSLNTGLDVTSSSLKLDDSWGAAVDAGVDVDLNKDWFLNASVWYIRIKTKGTIDYTGGPSTVNVDINPWALSVGIGRHF